MGACMFFFGPGMLWMRMGCIKDMNMGMDMDIDYRMDLFFASSDQASSVLRFLLEEKASL